MTPIPVHTIFMHPKPHFDEYFAEIMLRCWGEKHFPGIRNAKVDFDGTGGKTLDGTNGDELLKDGFLLLGIGKGMFDEHPGAKGEEKGECTSTLVARYLGIENEPALKEVLRFAKAADTKGNSHPFDLASVVKAMNEEYKPQEVLTWLTKAIMAKCRQQELFAEAARLVKETPMEEIPGQGGIIKMITAKTDNKEFQKAARKHGATIVIQQKSTGNVQIFTDKRAEQKIHDVVQMIRLEEQESREEVKTTDWKELASDGSVPGAEMWYFQEEAQNLYNGTTSHPDIEPTKIPLEVIQRIVRIGLNPKEFEPSRQETCLKGTCSSTPKDTCPWYELGLHRCRKLRYMEKTK